ncbi:MAG: hypothetical protein HOV68_00020, partial [Streptomycetaceae bacterium]|nr:hypothetical protein [Streptomycetaceae bacterium]
VARHGAVVVEGAKADAFFPGLLARVEALQHLTEPAPSRELSVARLKRALPDPVRRIDLHELVDAEAMRVVARLSDGGRYPPGERVAGAEAYRTTLERYQTDCDTLLHLLAVGAFHDEAGAHARVWVRTLHRLLNVGGNGGPGPELHRYPALLALSAAGCAAVLAGQDDLLGRLLLEPTVAEPGPSARGAAGEARPAVLALRPDDVLGDGGLLNALAGEPHPPSRVQMAHSTWLRERLRDVLAEPAADSERAVTEAFDRFEYLTALLHADLSETPVTLGEFTLPDRWDGEGRLRVAAHVQAGFSEGWPMLRSGAFGGEIQRAHTAAAVVDLLCAERYQEAVGREPFR